MAEKDSRPLRPAWYRSQVRALLLTAALLQPIRLFGAPPETVTAPQPQPQFVTKSLQGRVVWLAEAMTRLQGIKTVPEATDRVLALETDEGQLHPIMEDIRGRAFRRDERLRKMNVELLVRQYQGSPMVQIVQVLELAEDGRFEIDYWCEICSIAMFELKECECCQGPIEFRRRRAEAD